MITLTSEQDKKQLRKHALKQMRSLEYDSLLLLLRELKCTDFIISKKCLEYFQSCSAREGDIDVIDYLIEKGASLYRYFHLLAHFDNLDVLQYVVEKYKLTFKDASKLDKHKGMLALCSAASLNRMTMFKYIMSLGVETKLVLSAIAKYGEVEILDYYLSQKKERPNYMSEALCWSARRGHMEMVKYLVEKGVNVDYQNGLAYRSAKVMGHGDVASYIRSVSKSTTTPKLT